MTEDRDVEISCELADFVAELRRLADALERGEAFTIHIDGEEVEVPDGASFQIAHEREDGTAELEFQLTWSEPEDENEEVEDEAEDEDADA